MFVNIIFVMIDEFLESLEFFKDQMDIWLMFLVDIKVVCWDVLVGEELIIEMFFGGVMGIGKIVCLYVVIVYQMYCLSCFKILQCIYGFLLLILIIFMCQFVLMMIIKCVIYELLCKMFMFMFFVVKYVLFDKVKEFVFDLEGNIKLVFVFVNVQLFVGQVIIGFIVDEINFMVVIEKFKQVFGVFGGGGKYDQVEDVYWNLLCCCKFCFVGKVFQFGVLNIVFFMCYKGDFLDRCIDEVCNELDEDVNIGILWRCNK